MDNRIANFCKLYSGLQTIDTHFIVAHRNFITLYDMAEGIDSINNYCMTLALD